MEAAARGASWHRRHGPRSSSCHHPAAPAHPSASNPASLASKPSAAPAVARQSRSWHGASDSGATASCPGDSGTGRGQLVQPGAPEQTWLPGMRRSHRSFESAQMSPKGAWHNARPAQGLLSCFEDQAGQMGGTWGRPPAAPRQCVGTWPAQSQGGAEPPGGLLGRAVGGSRGCWCHKALKAKRVVGGAAAPCPAVQIRSELLRSSERGGWGAASWLQLTEECLFAEKSVIFPALYLFAAT